MNILNIRRDFPILERKVHGKQIAYLDNAATSQKPRQVIEAITKYYFQSNANVHRGIHSLSVEATEAYEGARRKVAAFVGVKDIGEVIFLRNTDSAINLVAHSWGWENIGKNDEIVVTIAEHHANFIPWQQLAMEKGAELKIVAVDDNGELDLDGFVKALTKRIKLVSFFHVSNVLGTINDVRTMCALVHKLSPDAKILVDGAQAVPHLPVNIPKLGCDFYAFSGHKMLGPTGIGVLWARREILESMSPYEYGGDMISKVTVEKSTWNELPWKFEAGTPNIEGAIGLGAAVDYLKKIGMSDVREHEVELTKYALGKMAKIPEIRILGPKDLTKRAGVIAFSLGIIPAHDIASILDSEGVEVRSGFNCAEPLMAYLKTGPVARASFYIYNTKEEVDRLAEGIEKVRKVFGLTKNVIARS